MGKNKKIQIVKTISNEDDKVVIEAHTIAEQFKVLPYPEAQKRLEPKMSNFSLGRANKG